MFLMMCGVCVCWKSENFPAGTKVRKVGIGPDRLCGVILLIKCS